MEAGTTMVGYQPLGNYVNFFRMIVSNPASTKTDIDFMLDEIERLGKTIEFEESWLLVSICMLQERLWLFVDVILEILETLRFLCLNERKVSLVAICAVI